MLEKPRGQWQSSLSTSRCLSTDKFCVLVQVRELIYREILEYHPTMLADYLQGGKAQPNFMYPSAVDNFKRQFAQLESSGGRGSVAVGGIGQVLKACTACGGLSL